MCIEMKWFKKPKNIKNQILNLGNYICGGLLPGSKYFNSIKYII